MKTSSVGSEGPYSVVFFQANIAKRCRFKNRSTVALELEVIWICSGLVLYTLYAAYPQVIPVAVVVIVLSTEGFFSVAWGILRWGRNLGDVIYDQAMQFVAEKFSDANLREALQQEVSYFREALQLQYNTFFPFRNLNGESSDKQIFRSMCQALSHKCATLTRGS